MIRSQIKGSGSALPKRCVTNEELAAQVDTSDEWIVERTGIRQRYIAGEGETTATLATDAARKALEDAGMDASEIDLIVLATATPDNTFPATATKVQHALGCHGGIAFDVAAVCSGFLYALATADSMLRSGMATRALVIGAETFSRILDWEDRTLACCSAMVLALSFWKPASARIVTRVSLRRGSMQTVRNTICFMSMAVLRPRRPSVTCG